MSRRYLSIWLDCHCGHSIASHPFGHQCLYCGCSTYRRA